MRFLVGGAIAMALMAAAPQSSSDLRARYGEPDVQRFAIRPDITMTVEYGDDHRACILDIEPRQAFIRGTLPQMKTVSKEQMLQVLDEVAPPETRGVELKPLFSNDFQSGSQCRWHATSGLYANVSIGLTYVVCDPPMGHLATGVQEARVQFKRPACDSLTKWRGQ